VILGQLVGHDQVQNLVLSQAKERVYAEDADVEIVDLGLYVVRGDNVCIIGEYQEDQWKNDPCAPLPALDQRRI